MSELEAQKKSLNELLAEVKAKGVEAEETIRELMKRKEEMGQELELLKGQFIDTELLTDAKEAE